MKGKTHITAKFQRGDLVICSHSGEVKTPFYSRINRVPLVFFTMSTAAVTRPNTLFSPWLSVIEESENRNRYMVLL